LVGCDVVFAEVGLTARFPPPHAVAASIAAAVTATAVRGAVFLERFPCLLFICVIALSAMDMKSETAGTDADFVETMICLPIRWFVRE